mgnify:CR=1 FL=1
MTRKQQIYERLKQDHDKIRELMAQIADTSEDQAGQRRDLFARFRTELLAHAQAESNVFYERLEEYGETRMKALEGETEHELVEHMIHELEHTSPGDDHWTARFQVLQEILEHHLEEEEEEMFEQAQDVLSDPKAMELSKQFEQEKSELRQRL